MQECPICHRPYNHNGEVCLCGYQRTRSYRQEDRLFEIYKFSKAIFCHQIPWPASPVACKEINGQTVVLECLERERSIANVCFPTDSYVRTDCGILPFTPEVVSLIINVDQIGWDLLDESNIRMLFLGDRVQKIDGFQLTLYPLVKYIMVDPKNQHFSSDNNVLFDKEKETLLSYARCKEQQEYAIPSTVKYVCGNAFFHCTSLKIIHASRKVRFSPNAIVPEDSIQIRYDLP